MRKSFGGKLNGLFTFQEHSYVEDLQRSLAGSEEIKEIFTSYYVTAIKLKKLLDPKYRIEFRDTSDTFSTALVKSLFNNEAIFVGGYSALQIIRDRYNFAPLQIAIIQMTNTYFYYPIYTGSPIFRQLYFW